MIKVRGSMQPMIKVRGIMAYKSYPSVAADLLHLRSRQGLTTLLIRCRFSCFRIFYKFFFAKYESLFVEYSRKILTEETSDHFLKLLLYSNFAF